MTKRPLVSRLRSALPKNIDLTEIESLTATEQVQQLLNCYQVDVSYRKDHLNRIPKHGKLMLLANDPMPHLSYLALLHLVLQIRPDVRVLMPEPAELTDALSEWIIATDHGSLSMRAFEASRAHLESGGVLIVFPVYLGRAIGVPKLNRERWPEEFLDLAKLSQSPLLHIHIGAASKAWLQALTSVVKGIKPLQQTAHMLVPSAFKLRLSVGEIIDVPAYSELNLRNKLVAKLLRKQLYRVADGRTSYFQTLENIAPPEERDVLIDKLKASELLGRTRDNKQIYVCRLSNREPLLREIGRLREESFRVVGEGSGRSRDIDEFDLYYEHIILWDEEDEEVVGAYRLCPAYSVNWDQLYTSTLMRYEQEAGEILDRGVELGRSFVQPRYWGSRSLDYLWVGIAAYLKKNPRARYLLGAVSISDAYSAPAKDLLVAYYQRYYAAPEAVISCRMPFQLSAAAREKARNLFDGLDAKEAFVVLKEQLGLLGHSVPTLYKQYTELCEPGGALFHGFNIDPDFQHCIDGLVVVDLQHLKALKRKRYGLEEHDFQSWPMASKALENNTEGGGYD